MRGAYGGRKTGEKKLRTAKLCRPHIFELTFSALYLLDISRLYSSFDNLEILREAVLSL